MSCVAPECRNGENYFYCLRFQFCDLFISLSASPSHRSSISVHTRPCRRRRGWCEPRAFVQLISSSANAYRRTLSFSGYGESALPSSRSYSHLIINYFLIYVVSNCITKQHIVQRLVATAHFINKRARSTHTRLVSHRMRFIRCFGYLPPSMRYQHKLILIIFGSSAKKTGAQREWFKRSKRTNERKNRKSIQHVAYMNLYCAAARIRSIVFYTHFR